ncbi:MAG: helix-turn-helix transcriptional regulator [Gallionellaceae bacterium]|nr:helix-turn-helix transcriptional regulator [Gallionellaceae bacterium]
MQARKQTGLTQAEVAARVGMAQSALARIESSLGSRKHSPSLATLRRYTEACGKNDYYHRLKMFAIHIRAPLNNVI